jgi:hypothetical protein
MPFSMPLSRLVHENLSIIMDFCFSRIPLINMVNSEFVGEWKYLRKSLFTLSQERADKAAIELALFLRLLDDREGISGYLNQTQQDRDFGRIIFKDKPEQSLKLRNVANKIIHASELRWDVSITDKPVLICISQYKEKWESAEIDVISLASFCGGLGF